MPPNLPLGAVIVELFKKIYVFFRKKKCDPALVYPDSHLSQRQGGPARQHTSTAVEVRRRGFSHGGLAVAGTRGGQQKQKIT